MPKQSEGAGSCAATFGETGLRLVYWAALAALVLLLAACGGEGEKDVPGTPQVSGTGGATGPASGADGRPNIVLVLADDLDRSVFENSTLDSAWEPEGASFTNA